MEGYSSQGLYAIENALQKIASGGHLKSLSSHLIARERMLWWSLGFLLIALTAFFLLSLFVTDINRIQEHWYLGTAFERLKTEAWVNRDDPFTEIAPHVMYFLAKVLKVFDSLLAVRLLQWFWTLLSVSLFWVLLHRLTGFARNSVREVAGMTALGLFLWVSLPLGFVYPIEANGAWWGLACMGAGFLLLREYPNLAIIAFGLGYAHKAQFMMYFPCLVFWRIFLAYPGRHEPILWHLLRSIRDLSLFFVPAVVFLPILYAALGWFRTFYDFKMYALEGPTMLAEQVLGVIKGILGMKVHANPDMEANRLVTLYSELASYSKLVYMHIALSIVIGLAGFLWALWARLPAFWGKPRADGPPAEIALVSVMLMLAWLTYFKFNYYPYCYNMLFQLPFSFFVVPYVVWELARRLGPLIGNVMVVKIRGAIFLLVTIFVLFLGFRYTRNFLSLPAGNAMKPYYWMQGQAWTESVG